MQARLCLNAASIKTAPLARQIELAGAAGFRGIGLWMDDIDAAVSGGLSLDRIAALVRSARLEVEELCFLGRWQDCDDAELPPVLEEAERIARVARSLMCPVMVAVPSMRRGSLAEAARRFREVCTAAAAHDVRVALEFVGTAEEVRDIGTARRLVHAADCANGGLLLDTFHFFLGGSTAEELAAVPPAKVFLVHVSDAMKVSRDQLATFHDYRTFPGDGVIDFFPVMEWMERARYRGAVSLEIWNQDLLKSDPAVAAHRGTESMRKLFSRQDAPAR